MKAESLGRARRRGPLTREAAHETALEVFTAMVGSPERTERFLAATGLGPGEVRRAAAEPGFWPALLDHVAADEALLLELSRETGLEPDRIMEARRVLSPEADPDG